MSKKISTDRARKKLSEDLGLHFEVDAKIVPLFFDKASTDKEKFQITSSAGIPTIYWVAKPNYMDLIKQRETFASVKGRAKAKALKLWRGDLENLLPEKKKRFALYEKIFYENLKVHRANLPNPVIINIIVDTIGHYDKEHHRGFNAHHIVVEQNDYLELSHH